MAEASPRSCRRNHPALCGNPDTLLQFLLCAIREIIGKDFFGRALSVPMAPGRRSRCRAMTMPLAAHGFTIRLVEPFAGQTIRILFEIADGAGGARWRSPLTTWR